MFEEFGENNPKYYNFELSNLRLSNEAALLLALNEYTTMLDLLELNKEQFMDKFDYCADEILNALNEKGYVLNEMWEHNGKPMNIFSINQTGFSF